MGVVSCALEGNGRQRRFCSASLESEAFEQRGVARADHRRGELSL
jgi:hypothetical protein